eukprot:692174_1
MPRIRLSSNKTLATPDITHTLRWEYMAMELEFDINLLTEFRQAEKQRIFSSGFKLLNLRGNIEFYPKGNYEAKDKETQRECGSDITDGFSATLSNGTFTECMPGRNA